MHRFCEKQNDAGSGALRIPCIGMPMPVAFGPIAHQYFEVRRHQPGTTAFQTRSPPIPLVFHFSLGVAPRRFQALPVAQHRPSIMGSMDLADVRLVICTGDEADAAILAQAAEAISDVHGIRASLLQSSLCRSGMAARSAASASQRRGHCKQKPTRSQTTQTTTIPAKHCPPSRWERHVLDQSAASCPCENGRIHNAPQTPCPRAISTGWPAGMQCGMRLRTAAQKSACKAPPLGAMGWIGCRDSEATWTSPLQLMQVQPFSDAIEGIFCEECFHARM